MVVRATTILAGVGDLMWYCEVLHPVPNEICAGGAAAASEMNGWRWAGGQGTHFFRMPIKMRSLELSLWFSSVSGAIVGGAAVADILEGRRGGETAEQRGRGPVCKDEPSLL